MKMPPGSKPFQLLEINLISAQDLEPVTRPMRTYAKAWVNPNRKLSSRVDAEGGNNPTWNDKFVFRVNEAFLREDTSAVMIQIYASHWFRDILIGTVRVLVGNLIPPPARSQNAGMRFVALQIRRPSGRPQGILNVGVALLGGSMRSMPLYRQLSASAVGFRDLMQDPPALQQLQQKNNESSNNHPGLNLNPVLHRSRSERSEQIRLDNYSPNSSIVSLAKVMKVGGAKGGSILTISEAPDAKIGKKKKGKASSVISGAELRDKTKKKGKKSKASSVVSNLVVSKGTSAFYKNENPKLKDKVTSKGDEKQDSDKTTNKVVDEKLVVEVDKGGPNTDKSKDTIQMQTSTGPTSKPNGYDCHAPQGPFPKDKNVIGGPFKGNSILSESEVGPSPSEVAATMAERKYPLYDNQSSVLDGWSVDESVEGLRSKLDMWRAELPPLYDHGFSSSSHKSSSHHGRRHSDSGRGAFTCFGYICGYECQCVCGKPPQRRKHKKRLCSPSVDTSGN